jgi:hypothetical protein
MGEPACQEILSEPAPLVELVISGTGKDLGAVVTKGRLPWKPCPDARDVNVWHEYEHPHIGTFTSDVGAVMFSVLGGVETDVSLWAYACLAPDEAHELDGIEFNSLADLREFIDSTYASHRLVFALAGDLLITSWAVAERTGPLYEVATDFLEQVVAQTRSPVCPRPSAPRSSLA